MKTIEVKIEGITDVAHFAQIASKVNGDIAVSRGRWTIDGKSVMGLYGLNMSQGVKVEYPEDAEEFDTFIKQFATSNKVESV